MRERDFGGAYRLFYRAARLETAAKELSEATGRKCIFAQADVRRPSDLKAAVEKTISTFGRIDFVICGTLWTKPLMLTFNA